MPLGEQALPVRSAEPALVKITTRFICRVRSCTASAMAELGTSRIRSTLSFSYHRRAVAADVHLFWWSAEITSIGLPSTVPPKSSTAIFTASTPYLPDRSAIMPDWSPSTPILTTSSDTWAWADQASAPARRRPGSV